MPTVGSWCEFDVICSAITALIQWTSPCVGFWLCTPPTGIVVASAAADDGGGWGIGCGIDVDEQVVAVGGAGELPDIGVAACVTCIELLLLLLLLLVLLLLLCVLLLLFGCDVVLMWWELIPVSPDQVKAATAAFWN